MNAAIRGQEHHSNSFKMKNAKNALETLENDAIEKFLAYAALRRSDPSSPDVPVLRKMWQEASDLFRAELSAGRENRLKSDEAA